MKKLITFSLLIGFSFNVAVAAGVPVFDGVANKTSLQQWAEKLQQWQQTVVHYKNQIDVASNQLNALKDIKDHVRNFDINSLARDISIIDNYIPNYDAIVNEKWSRDAEILAKKLGINDKCKSNYQKISNLCKSENMNLATNYIATEKVSAQVNAISKKIQKLSKEMSISDNIKTTSDINNQILVYNEQLETLDRKLSIAQRQYEMNNELIQSQREIAIRELNLKPTSESFKRFQDLLKHNRNKNSRINNF